MLSAVFVHMCGIELIYINIFYVCNVYYVVCAVRNVHVHVGIHVYDVWHGYAMCVVCKVCVHADTYQRVRFW